MASSDSGCSQVILIAVLVVALLQCTENETKYKADEAQIIKLKQQMSEDRQHYADKIKQIETAMKVHQPELPSTEIEKK